MKFHRSKELLKFNLRDIFFLSTYQLQLLQNYGIANLADLCQITPYELQYLLGISKIEAARILRNAQLLNDLKIPVNNSCDQKKVIWIYQQSQDEFKIGLLDLTHSLRVFQIQSSRVLQDLFKSDQVLTIGDEIKLKSISPQSWESYLREHVLLGYEIDHDYIFSRLTGNRSTTRHRFKSFQLSNYQIKSKEPLTTIKMENLTLYLHEINTIIGAFTQLKQSRNSSILLSSVNKTANNPPRL